MNIAYLITGSNLGDRKENLAVSKRLIHTHCGIVIKESLLYETAPWGKTDQPAFLNQALEIQTSLQARQLMRRILKVEKMMGRVREEKYGPRLIDIDILFFNNEKHNYQLLKLPHPEIQNRRFVLQPLQEIAPNYVHPVLQKTVTQLLEKCNDPLEVKALREF